DIVVHRLAVPLIKMPEPCVLRVRDAACRYMELDPRLKVIWQNSRRKYAFEQTLAPSSLWDNADASGKRMSRPRPAKHQPHDALAASVVVGRYYDRRWPLGDRFDAMRIVSRKSA